MKLFIDKWPRLWKSGKWTFFFVSLLSSFHVHHFNIKWLLLNRSKPWVKWTLIAFNPRKIHTWEVPAFLPSLRACLSNLLRTCTLPAIEKCAFFFTFLLFLPKGECVLGTEPCMDKSLWHSAQHRSAEWFSESLKAMGYKGTWSGRFHFH